MLTLIVLTLCGLLSAQQSVYAASAFAVQEPLVQSQESNNANAHNTSETEVKFDGNKIFSAIELTGMMKRCQARYSTSEGTSDPAKVFDECLRRIRFFYTKHGYLNAAFGEQQKQGTERGVRIVVPVKEGVRYRIGEIKVEGAKLFSPEQIIEMLNVKTGDVANGEAIGVGLFERLRKAYANKGYIQYEAEPTPDFKPVPAGETEGVVDFNISITEGKVFRVRSIKFDGNSLVTDEAIRNAFLLKEGDIYSQRLFENSIKKLNQSGLFENAINADRDVDFHQKEETPSSPIVATDSDENTPGKPTLRRAIQAVNIEDSESADGEIKFLDITIHVKEKVR